MRRLLVMLLAVTPLIGACGGASVGSSARPGDGSVPAAVRSGAPGVSPSGPTAGGSGTSATPVPATVSNAPSAPGRRSDALVFRMAEGTAGEPLLSIDAATGAVGAHLPIGVPDQRWSTLYTTTSGPGTTTVRALDVRTGAELRHQELAGDFALPQVVPGDLPDGLAGDRLVLVDRTAGPSASQFAILDTSFASPPAFVTLDGRFDFDAVGPNRQYLFLIEHLGTGTGHYQVRAYDLFGGALLPGAIVDKREIGEQMEGQPVARAIATDEAWAWTVYAREDGSAFIHQLDTATGIAFCVDLPDELRATTSADLGAWRMATTGTEGGYVANGRLGFLGMVGMGDLAASTRLGGTSVKGLATGRLGDAYVLEPKVLTVLTDRCRLPVTGRRSKVPGSPPRRTGMPST